MAMDTLTGKKFIPDEKFLHKMENLSTQSFISASLGPRIKNAEQNFKEKCFFLESIYSINLSICINVNTPKMKIE